MKRFPAAAAGLILAWGVGPCRAAELRVLVKDQHGKWVSDAVDRVDKQFVPYVKPVLLGSKVRFPNSDDIRHQVYSFSTAKKFELPLNGCKDASPVVFDKPGEVVLGCNIHDWMVGYIYVSETPYFTKTDAAGTAVINDMPPGEYSVRIWHPSMEHGEESTTRRVNLSADAPASVEWDVGLKPTFRVPRVSGAAPAGYP